jgi:hypothetical protein
MERERVSGVICMANAVYYIDTAIPGDKKEGRKRKTHVAFDGSRVFRVKMLTELEDAGEVFIDALFPELCGDVLELLKRGVRVYLLKNTTKLKRLKMENNLKKSDENDAMLLARIPREAFRPLTVEELELKMRMEPLVRKYRRIMLWKKILKRLVSQGFDDNFKEALRLMDADRRKISEEIIRRVAALPIYGEVYKKALQAFGIKKSAELAVLVIELPLYLPLVRLKGLLGLVPDRNRGRYNRRLRGHITAFAASLYLCVKKGASVSNEVAEIVNRLPKRMALYKLQLMTLKILRVAYLTTMNPLVGG